MAHCGLKLGNTLDTQGNLGSNTNDLAISSSSRSQSDNVTSRLPREILWHVFIATYKLYHRSNESLNNTSLPCEVIISHVCTSWRAAALSLPYLWAAFRCTSTSASPSIQSSRFSVYSSRSGERPLDLCVDFRLQKASELEAKQWTSFFQVLIGAIARWRRFTLFVSEPPEHWRLLQKLLADARAPLLAHFTFCVMWSPIIPPPPIRSSRPDFFLRTGATSFLAPVLFRAGAPVLSSVRLDSVHHIHHIPPLHAHLQTLRIDAPHANAQPTAVQVGHFVELLRLPLLRNLSISGIWVNGRGPAITMQNLKELRCHGEGVFRSFSTIQTPALETLVLKNVDLNSFPCLAVGSSPEIKRLVLIDCPVLWHSFMDELSHISAGITHLIVSEDYTMKDYFRLSSNVFYFANNARNGWPSLEYLGYNIPATPAKAMAFYKEFARSRAPNSSTLQINSDLLGVWEIRAIEGLTSLHDSCIVQQWDGEHPLLPLHWPYEEEAIWDDDTGDYFDAFRLTPNVTM